ncbi:MAG: hypothetical protein Q4E20_07090 [Eubacteriales bacterium]|nr:hypothetical protein [Eubacteriales bacterium]
MKCFDRGRENPALMLRGGLAGENIDRAAEETRAAHGRGIGKERA